jgi:hypothetical protein
LTGSGWTSGRPGTPSWQSLAFPHMYKSPFSAQTIKNKSISSCKLFTDRKFDYLHLVNRRRDVESQWSNATKIHKIDSLMPGKSDLYRLQLEQPIF